MSLIHHTRQPSRRRRIKHRQWANGIPDGGFHLRIFLIRLARWSFRLAMSLLILTGLGFLAWGGKLAFNHAFYDNPDYRLRSIQLNPNEAINERDLLEITGLDPDTILFRIDTAELTRRLLEHPSIKTATAELQTPGTLIVKVTARSPRAWLATTADRSQPQRQPQALLVAEDGVVYPCPLMQFEIAKELPVIELSANEEYPLTVGKVLRHPELAACSRLIRVARDEGDQGIAWIESVSQPNTWSLALTSRDGTVATFGLRDHLRQLNYLHAAFDHARGKGYQLATINLIPRENVPITLSAPRAVIFDEDEPAEASGPPVTTARNRPVPAHRN